MSDLNSEDPTVCSGRNAKGKAVDPLKCDQCMKKKLLFLAPTVIRKCIVCSASSNGTPHLKEEEISALCPYCRGNCICNACLHSSGMSKTSKRDISHSEKIQHLQYILHSLLPQLKQICEEQTKEIEIEANILGNHILKLKCHKPFVTAMSVSFVAEDNYKGREGTDGKERSRFPLLLLLVPIVVREGFLACTNCC